MAVLETGDLTIPTQILDPWLKNVSDGAVVPQLSGATPMKFGAGEAFIFDIGEAEYVGEGSQKGPSTVTSRTQSVNPYKFHKTVRWTEEVQWADEDHQLGVVQEILNLIQPALSRALDFGVLHGIDPNTGTRPGAMAEALTDTANVVSAGEGVELIDAADQLVLATGNVPRDIALAPGFAGEFATLRDRDGRRLFPDLNLGANISTFENHRAATSRTVSDLGIQKGESGVSAFIGDFSNVEIFAPRFKSGNRRRPYTPSSAVASLSRQYRDLSEDVERLKARHGDVSNEANVHNVADADWTLHAI